MGHSLPYLLGGECKHGSDDAVKGAYDAIHGALCRAARRRIALFNINAVLGYIDIQLGHIDRAEVVHCMIDKVELICVITIACSLDERIETRERPAVDVKKLVYGHKIAVRLEITEIRHNDTGCIADLAVCFGKLLEDIIGSTHVYRVVT